MQVQKSKLLEILESLKAGLSTDDVIENFASICFDEETVYTFNDLVYIRYPFKTDFIGSVKEDRFFKHIKKAGADKEGFIGLSEMEGDLVISSGKKGKTKAGIPMILFGPTDANMVDADEVDWKKLPKDFPKALKLAMFCAGTDYDKPKLTCVHVKGKMVESSDNSRAFRHTLKKKIKDEFLVPAKSIPALLKHDLHKYGILEGWIFFKTKAGVIVSLRMHPDISYPDMSFLFDLDGHKFEFPEEMVKTIDKAVDFIGDDDDDETGYLHIKIDPKKITASSRSTHGWFKEPIKAKSDVNMSFFVSPSFLKDIFKSTRACEVDDARGLLRFETAEWEHVLNISVD